MRKADYQAIATENNLEWNQQTKVVDFIQLFADNNIVIPTEIEETVETVSTSTSNYVPATQDELDRALIELDAKIGVEARQDKIRQDIGGNFILVQGNDIDAIVFDKKKKYLNGARKGKKFSIYIYDEKFSFISRDKKLQQLLATDQLHSVKLTPEVVHEAVEVYGKPNVFDYRIRWTASRVTSIQANRARNKVAFESSIFDGTYFADDKVSKKVSATELIARVLEQTV